MRGKVTRKKVLMQDQEEMLDMEFDFKNKKKYMGDAPVVEKYYKVEVIEAVDSKDGTSQNDKFYFDFMGFSISKGEGTRKTESSISLSKSATKAKLLIENKKIILIGTSHNRRVNYADILQIAKSKSEKDYIIGIYIMSKTSSSMTKHKNMFLRFDNKNDFEEAFSYIESTNIDRKNTLVEEFENKNKPKVKKSK